MARPERHDVDYFPFFAKRGKTLNILQSKYGLEGIGFFTNLMRFLALTPDHYYCIKEEYDKLNFFAEIGIEEEKGIAMIELMVKTGKLDRMLWEAHKVIACEMFLESLDEAYKKRINQIITIDEIRAIFETGGENPADTGVDQQNVQDFDLVHKKVNVDINPVSGTGNPVNVAGNPAESHFDEVSGSFPTRKGAGNPQSKVKKSKVKKSKFAEAKPPRESEAPSSSQKPRKPSLLEREPENDYERVEKAYLQNWDTLYGQGKVKTDDPIVNRNQIMKLLKRNFEKLKPDQIIQALKNGMEDDFVLSGGYSLGVILSASVLNRLINAEKTGERQGRRIANDNMADDIDKYFREV
jgi:hypothetical protein